MIGIVQVPVIGKRVLRSHVMVQAFIAVREKHHRLAAWQSFPARMIDRQTGRTPLTVLRSCAGATGSCTTRTTPTGRNHLRLGRTGSPFYSPLGGPAPRTGAGPHGVPRAPDAG